MDMDNKDAEIMVVDDARETLQLLSRILHRHGYEVRPASDGQIAFTSAKRNPPDLALIDISMTGLNGYELCRLLKSNEETRSIPVIFISALDDVRNKVKAFQVGAVDYITKPFQFQDVLARIRIHLEMSRKIQELNKLRDMDRYSLNVANHPGEDAYRYVVHDIRNPLHVICLNVALLQKHLADSDQQSQQYCERIMRNLEIVKQIMAESVA